MKILMAASTRSIQRNGLMFSELPSLEEFSDTYNKALFRKAIFVQFHILNKVSLRFIFWQEVLFLKDGNVLLRMISYSCKSEI